MVFNGGLFEFILGDLGLMSVFPESVCMCMCLGLGAGGEGDDRG